MPDLLMKLWTLSPQQVWKKIKAREICGLKKDDFRKLQQCHPKTETEISFFGRNLTIADSLSFLYMHKEIFVNEIYKFKTGRDLPVIIDGGANIGLSIIYLKQLYPKAKIIAFEPDPDIFRILKKNIESFDFIDTILFQEGLASEEGIRHFISDKSDGGRFIEEDSSNAISLKVVPLRKYICDTVDLLKLDIEGCELEVLQSIKDKLSHVKNIFVEYHSYKEKEQNLDEILNILNCAGFRYKIESVFRTKNPLMGSVPNGLMDMQLNIFAFKAG